MSRVHLGLGWGSQEGYRSEDSDCTEAPNPRTSIIQKKGCSQFFWLIELLSAGKIWLVENTLVFTVFGVADRPDQA